MKRVIVLESNSLFGQGMTTLLVNDPALQLEIVPYIDDAGLVRRLEQRPPDVMLLTEESPLDLIRILNVLKAAPASAALRIIIVRRNFNSIELYEKRQVAVASSQDVLMLIHNLADLTSSL